MTGTEKLATALIESRTGRAGGEREAKCTAKI
jgi:hypothetical protein